VKISALHVLLLVCQQMGFSDVDAENKPVSFQ